MTTFYCAHYANILLLLHATVAFAHRSGEKAAEDNGTTYRRLPATSGVLSRDRADTMRTKTAPERGIHPRLLISAVPEKKTVKEYW